MNPAPDTKTLPQPGDLILYSDTTWNVPRWRVARVVAVGKVMWTIEHTVGRLTDDKVGWATPCKRKIGRWKPLRADPLTASLGLLAAARAHREAYEAADKAYLDAALRIAAGETA